MKKLILGLILCFFIFFNGLNKHNAVVYLGEVHSANANTWTELDLGAYTGNQQAYIIMDFSHTAYASDPTEWGAYQVRGLSDNIIPGRCTTVYGGEKGRIYVLTDNDGKIEWMSEYTQPFVKRVTLEIRIQNSLD